MNEGARVAEFLNKEIQVSKGIEGFSAGSISDGCHTFDELYEHRIALYVSLCRTIEKLKSAYKGTDYEVWCSKKHSDGSIWQGWFLLGINVRQGKQITYHLPDKYWDEASAFADIRIMAPEFDGHTSADVLRRISQL